MKLVEILAAVRAAARTQHFILTEIKSEL